MGAPATAVSAKFGELDLALVCSISYEWGRTLGRSIAGRILGHGNATHATSGAPRRRHKGPRATPEFLLAGRAACARIVAERDAAIAPIIAELRAAGATLRAIAAELNQRRIPTALGTGKWSKTQVVRVMSRHEELKKFRLGRGAGMARIASERAAAIAPIIAELRAAGAASLRAIVAELIKRGIPTARGTGSWSASQVARMMSRNEGRKSRRRKSSHRV